MWSAHDTLAYKDGYPVSATQCVSMVMLCGVTSVGQGQQEN